MRERPLATLPATPAAARWWRCLVWAALIGVSLAVFAWYQTPGWMVHLADRLWSCF